MTFARMLGWEAKAFLDALLAVVALQALTGRIRLQGLFREKDGSISAARLQLFVATLATAAAVLDALRRASPGSPPVLDHRWLYLLSGSSGLYVAHELYGRFRSTRSS